MNKCVYEFIYVDAYGRTEEEMLEKASEIVQNEMAYGTELVDVSPDFNIDIRLTNTNGKLKTYQIKVLGNYV